MGLDKKSAAEIAAQFFGSSKPLVRLGWGISGFVFLSPDTRTAVKVHSTVEGFNTELLVYRKLASLKLTQIYGLTIPKLRGYRADVKLISMDFVIPPYLLDFAGVKLSPPDFSPETMAEWHEGIDQMFGPNASVAYAVHEALKKHGLYYLDFRPSNMKLDGLPGLEPYDTSSNDES